TSSSVKTGGGGASTTGASGSAAGGPLSSKERSNMNFRTVAIGPSSVNQLVVTLTVGDDQFASGGHLLREVDDIDLRLVDVAEAHRPQRFHVLLEELGRALRHVRED